MHWRDASATRPLKHVNAVIRVAEGGRPLVSFGAPFPRMLRPSESPEGAPRPNPKWRRALEAHMKDRGIDPNQEP
jgi:hypothetical protein